jgi:hypothetical protein
MFIELMFVPEEFRRPGAGRTIMHSAEAEALRRGCHGAWLETFTFRAQGFYKKLGYRIDLLESCGTPHALFPKAFRFVLAAPAVSSALIGHRGLDAVRDNLALLGVWP